MGLRNNLTAKVTAGIFLLVGFISAFSFIQASAQEAPEQPFWGVPQLPQLSVEDEAYTIPQYAGEHCSYEKFFVSVMDRSIPVPSQREDCSMSTVYGELTKDNFLRFKNETAYHHINPNIMPFMVPSKDTYFYSSGIGNGNRGLFALDNPRAAFEIKAGSRSGFQGVLYEKEYYVRSGQTTRALQRTTDNGYVPVHHLDASNDGNWLIVNLSSGRLARINPDTFETMVFPGSYPRFSQSSSVQPDLAISNDGRYAALSGGFQYSYSFRLYDLSTCTVPNPADNMSIAQNCRQQEITEFMTQHIPNFLRAEHLRFSSDATQLYMTVRLKDGGSQRVTLTAPGQTVKRLSYLALGDSFSSGEGDLEGHEYYEPGTDGSEEYPSEKCHLSRRSYPYLVAEGMNIPSDLFKSVACSGAVKEDVLRVPDNEQPRYFGHFGQFEGMEPLDIGKIKLAAVENFTPGREAQIEFVEKYKPEAITIGLGGNDIGFKAKLIDCIFSYITNVNASCAPALTEGTARANEGSQIRELYYDLKKLYQRLHIASEDTKIYVVGYPNIITTGTACDVNVFLDDNEREYAIQTVKYLNTVIRAAATDAGAHYIDIENSLAGKELCSGSMLEVGVNAMTPGNDNYFIVGNESYHPNQRGHAAIADAIKDNIRSLLDNDLYCGGGGDSWCPTGNVSPPPLSDYYVYEHDSFVRALYNHSMVKDVIQFPGNIFNAVVSHVAPGSSVYFTNHSEPVDLGEFIADEDGNVSADLIIPDSVPAGFHELHAVGTLPSGEQLDQYQIILVGHSRDDIDGDGIPNEADKCMFIEPANVDQDRDGIDDACDPFIDKPKLPGAPTVVLTDKINASTQSSVEIRGTAEENTTAVIVVDDEDDATEPVRHEAIAQAAADGGFSYVAQLDLSSLVDGSITVTVMLKNEYGEGEPAKSVSVKDTVAPSVQATLNPLANENGWHDDDVTVEIFASDEGSGVSRLVYGLGGAQAAESVTIDGATTSFTVSSEGETSVSYSAVDGFGNSSEPAHARVKIDASQPGISIHDDRNPAYIQLLDRQIRGISSDSLSDVRKVEVLFTNVKSGKLTTLLATCKPTCANWHVSPYVLPIGQYTVKAIAYDGAGNEASATMGKKITVVSLPAWLSRLF